MQQVQKNDFMACRQTIRASFLQNEFLKQFKFIWEKISLYAFRPVIARNQQLTEHFVQIMAIFRLKGH